MRLRSLLGIGLVAFFCAAPVPALAAPAWVYVPDVRPLRERAEHLSLLGIDRWHAADVRGRGVKVAVLDTGFRGWRDHLGRSLPKQVEIKSFRRDGNLEARDSQHGILCGEVVHALAPDAGLLFANWEPDQPETFLAAVRWAKERGAKVITCSVISPGWSDGEGGGPVHRDLAKIVGDGSAQDDVLFFACAGNVAERHWAGGFRAGADGWHEWAKGIAANPVSPWGGERVSVEMCWSDPESCYRLEVIDRATGTPLDACRYKEDEARLCVKARFTPEAGKDYAVRVRLAKGKAGNFHLTALQSYRLGEVTARGSIPFPGDGPAVVTVGAADADGKRASFSACGPNSKRPKPDLVAPIPFGSRVRAQPFGGTSAASPQAAALAALYWSSHSASNAGAVRDEICRAARDVGPKGHDAETGHGLIRLPAVKSSK